MVWAQVRGDTILLARLARWSMSRGLRRAAIKALQSMLVSDCTAAERVHTIGLLVEGLQLSVQAVTTHCSAGDGPSDSPEAIWQARRRVPILTAAPAATLDRCGEHGNMGTWGCPHCHSVPRPLNWGVDSHWLKWLWMCGYLLSLHLN